MLVAETVETRMLSLTSVWFISIPLKTRYVNTYLSDARIISFNLIRTFIIVFIEICCRGATAGCDAAEKRDEGRAAYNRCDEVAVAYGDEL